MSKQIPNVFEKLSISNWYKYLLYLAGILLITVLIFGSAFDQNKVVRYSISIIGISLFLWILDDILEYLDKYYHRTTDSYSDSYYLEKAKVLIVIKEIFHVIFFIIWIIITFRTF